MITEKQVSSIAIKPNKKIVAEIVKYFNIHAPKYGVTTPLRIAHFLAQAAHESANFRTLEEYASGAAYEGRKDLGNTQKGDGKRYKGRGIFQLTGRENYRKIGNILGFDLEGNPELAADPEISVLTALEYWKSRGLNSWADKDDVRTITRRINGGLNGFQDRQDKLNKAKIALVSMAGRTSPVITDRSTVRTIQNSLISMGYTDVGGVDGLIGTKTRGAINSFIADWNEENPADTIQLTTEITEELFSTITKAKAEGWRRPISEERQTATVKDLRKENEPIVSSADKIKVASGVLGAGTALQAASESGILDQLNTAGQQISVIQDALMPFHSLFSFFANYWFIPAILIAGYLIWQGIKVAKARLKDHQTGNTNLINPNQVGD